MASKRQLYDPLAKSNKPHWLARLDLHGRVIESDELPPGADLRASLNERITALREAGWVAEDFCYSGTFVYRGDVRHRVSIYPADPRDPRISLHGKYPGAD